MYVNMLLHIYILILIHLIDSISNSNFDIDILYSTCLRLYILKMYHSISIILLYILNILYTYFIF